MSKKKIALFFPDPKLEGLTWHRMPFSVLAISSPLVEKGYEVRIFDERFEKNLEIDIREYLSEAICIGISCFTGSQIEGALRVARVVRQAYPKLPIVWGGWHPSIFPEQTALDANVDIAVYGQGERTFLELVEALNNGSPLEAIPGLCFKHNGAIIKTPPRVLEDINNFPVKPLGLINVKNYIGPHIGLDGARTLSYFSSQGCPYRCGFCADKKVYQRRWFGLKPERVITEVTNLVRENSLEAVYFEDNNFFVDKNRVARICEGIINNRLNILWEAMGHPRQLSGLEDGFWELIYKSGCRRILIGAESGDEEILSLIKKDATVEDTISFVNKAQRHNITPILSTLVGFPKTGVRDLFRTIKLVTGIKAKYPKSEWKLFLYTPYPGTDLYDMALESGMKEPKTLPDWSTHTLRNVKTPWLDDAYRSTVSNIAFFYVQIAYPTKYVTDRLNTFRYKMLIMPFFKLMQLISRLRLNFNFYSFPLEPFVYKYFKRIWRKSG